MGKNSLRYVDAYVLWRDPKLFEKLQYQCGLPIYTHIGDSVNVVYRIDDKPDIWIQADGKVLPIHIKEDVTNFLDFHGPKKTLLSLATTGIISMSKG